MKNDIRPAFRQLKIKIEKWDEVDALSKELSQERGSTVTLADVVAEAVKFYRENRPKPGSGVKL